MNIEIYSTIDFFLQSQQQSIEMRHAQWQEHIVKPLQPLLETMQLKFAQLGAVEVHTFNERTRESALRLQAARIEERTRTAIEQGYALFRQGGQRHFPTTLKVALLLHEGSDPLHQELNQGFFGFGGLPGFILLILSPTAFVLERLEPLVAHEFHHNVRFLMDPWPADAYTGGVPPRVELFDSLR